MDPQDFIQRLLTDPSSTTDSPKGLGIPGIMPVPSMEEYQESLPPASDDRILPAPDDEQMFMRTLLTSPLIGRMVRGPTSLRQIKALAPNADDVLARIQSRY